MKVNFRIRLTRKQREAYEAFNDPGIRELVFRFSRQSGKSTLCKVLIIETLLRKKCNVVYITPDFNLGRTIYKDMLSLLLPTGLVRYRNATNLTLELTNGSELKFFSSKNINSLRGQTVTGGLFIDECADLPVETPDGSLVWDMIIRPTTKVHSPKIVFISTPKGKHGLFWDKYNESLTNPKVKCITATVDDDEHMTPEQKAEWRKSYTDKAWRQEFLVEFLDDASSAFDNFEGCFTPEYREDDVKLDEPLWMGIDFSTSGEDETVVTVVNREGRNRQWVIEGSLDAKYSKIASLIDDCRQLRLCYMESNSIGEPMGEAIRKLVSRNRSKLHYWTTTHSSKNGMVGHLQLLMDKGEISFPEDNKALRQQFGWFEVILNKATRTISYGAKSPRHDDRIMSLMMAVEAREARPASGGSRYEFVGTPVNRIG